MHSTIISGSPANTGNQAWLTLGLLAFLLLFPGFFFYQTLIGMGAMPAFLGGYFTAVSFALFVPLGFSYFLSVRASGYRLPGTDVYFAFFLAYFFLVVAINFVFGARASTARNHLFSILYFVNLFIIFRGIDLAAPGIRRAALAALLLMSAIIFYFSADGSFQLSLYGEASDPESVATYQGFARSYLFTFVAVICYVKRLAARGFLYFIAAVALFLNGSRSELAAMLFLIPIVEVYRSRHKLGMIFFIVLVVALFGLNLEHAMQLSPESRVWELADLSRSDSSNARDHLTLQALQTIRAHPILGDYGSYLSGQYSHNILSAWVDLGMFGFAYMLFMLILPAIKLLAGEYFLRAKSGDFLLACSLICITLLLLAIAKTFDDMLTGAAMGAYAHYKIKRRLVQAPCRWPANA